MMLHWRSIAALLLATIATGLACATDVLDPEEAFKVSVTRFDTRSIDARFVIAPGHYLYRDRIKFEVVRPAAAAFEPVVMPPGQIKDDPNFGRVEIYHDALLARIVSAREHAELDLSVEYQGCSEQGLCYPPVSRVFRVGSPAGSSGTVVDSDAKVEVANPPSALNEQGGIERMLSSGSLGLVIASFFGFGLLLAFTPCVFPMLPILSGIIVGQGANVTRARAIGLSVAYALGMALMYTLAGIAAGLSGTLLSGALQNAWVLGGFAMVFIVLALSMFGLYELQLPGGLQTRLSGAANSMRGGRVASVFAMGAMSALIVGPCVAAPLAGALLYIGKSRDIVLGGSALFAMALGMGVPLIAIGAFAGELMPRVGRWMAAVKQVFGVLLLGVALWLVSPVLPEPATLLAAAALMIGTAVFLRAVDPLPEAASGWVRFGKALGVFLLVLGGALVLKVAAPVMSASSGTLAASGSGAVGAPSFKRVANAAEFEREIAQASGKPVMIDFYADWCVSCKEMERFTLADPRVQSRLRDATLLKVDLTENRPETLGLLKRFGMFGPPGIVFFDRQGQEIPAARVVGFQPADRFLAVLDAAFQPR